MTFLQIINVIKETSLAQPNVNSFYREFLDLNREDIEYSSIILQDRDSELNRVSEQDWMTYTFHLGYVDRLTDDESNRDHIFSTGITVLGSIINSMRSTWGSALDVIVEDRIVTFNQRFTANCAGVYLVIGITVPMSDCTDAAQTDIYGKYEARITENGDYHILPDGPVSEIDINVSVPSGRKPEESLEENIYANGSYNYSPSEGSVFDSVTVNVSVPSARKPEESLEENIYSNGTYEYTPSEGKVFDSVTVNVSVPQSGKLETTFSVTPSTQEQTIIPDPGYVFSSGVVSAVSADIDSNITSGNIRNGVEILGVVGTMNPQKTEVSLSERITSNGSYTYSPEEGETFGSVDVTVSVPSDRKPEMTFSVTPSSTSQTIIPDMGYVFSSGVISAVSAGIDSNIVPSNIRTGVSILGVEGTMDPGKTEETLSRTITENGSYSYSPSSGSVFGSASITVSVPGATIPKPANDEIYYVSYDGKTITPNNFSDFGVNIVSNTVHSSGNYCVLKFDGNVTNTGLNSFESKTGLKEIYLPDSVTVIRYGSFANTGLQKCVMQDTVTTIYSNAFIGCYALVSPFRISNGCTAICPGSNIGAGFKYCTALVTITIPSTVTEIGRIVFEGCTHLEEVIVQATTPPVLIAYEGFYSQFEDCVRLQSIRVPRGTVNTYKSAAGWSTWANLIVEDYE